MKNKITGQLVLLSSLLLVASASAQPAIQESERTRRFQEIQAPTLKLQADEMAPELYAGENQDVGPQRVLKLKPRRTLFDVVADSHFYWSDNVVLAGSGAETESTIFVNTLQAAFAPGSYSLHERELLPRVGARAQWYNYGLDGSSNGLGIFDFHAETIFAEARYNFEENWQAMVGIDATRLMQQGSYDEFYREVAPKWGVQYLWKLADDKVVLFNYNGYYHFSTTVAPFTSRNINNRTDHSMAISYHQEICPGLVVQPFYRFQYTHYTAGSERDDLLHNAGVSLNYYFNRWASVRLFAIYEAKNSGDKTVVPSYDKIDAGLGATLDFQF